MREGFDCVLRVGHLSDSSLVARPLGHMAMPNMASPAYLAAHGEPQTLEDLSRHRLMQYVSSLGQRCPGFEWQDADGNVHFEPMGGVLTVSDSGAYNAACLAGLGIIQAPIQGSEVELADGRLRPILQEFQAAPMPVHLLYPHRRQLPRRVQVFMQWLADQVTPRVLPWDAARPKALA